MSTAFRISLDGAQQVPVVMSSASGLGTAIFDSATTSMSFTVNVKGLDWGPLLGQASQTPSLLDDINGVHIHMAARGVNGGIVLDWPSGGDPGWAVSGVLADGSRTLTSNWETTDPNSIGPFFPTFAAATLGADVPFYMNIHTVAFGGGEIRGQLVCIATDSGETVNGTTGNDILPGLGGVDFIQGFAGDDRLDGGTGADTMAGGLGNDTYVVDNVGDVVIESASEGTDTVISQISSYTRGADVENLTLQGLGDSFGAGNALVNVITGDFYDNVLSGMEGADTMIGGGGNDAYFVDNAGDVVTETAGGGTDTIYSTINYILPAEVEVLALLGSADLQGFGNSATNIISGNSGSNTIDGGVGVDVMYGGAGNDSYYVDNAGDAVI